MSAFQLDTSGFVGEMPGWRTPVPTCNRVLYWSDLTPFAQGYVEALLGEASRVDKRGDVYITPDALKFSAVIRPYAFSDLAPETLARIIEDCERIQSRGVNDAAMKNPDDKGGTFWRLRQANVYPSFPPLTVRLGDDGKVYLREAAQ